ncbi:MAG: hypothetical protein HY794_06325 [Desulfarculus sp.]|nr:hypothetical protein [Desulfarculus sp.]
MKNAVDSLHSSIPSITEYAIVSYCGLFETYIQCWALNFLLAKLESGDAWTSTERKLAHAFSPLASPRLPSFIDICKYIPIIKETFNILPHVFVNPKTSKEVEAPITPNLNAFQTVLFWRDWRNLLVHTSGMVNQWFYKKHAMFFADFKSVFPHIRDIEVGKKLSLNDATFRAMATTHYRAARSLRPILVGISSARRGHIMAPGPASDSGKVNPEKLPERVPLMLMAGDHQASYRWTSDPGFRQVISSTLTGNSQARKAVSEA